MRSRCSSGTPSARRSVSTPAPRLRLATRATYGTPISRPAAKNVQLVAGHGRDATTSARSRARRLGAGPLATAMTSEPELPGPSDRTAAIGVSPTTRSTWCAGATARGTTSIAPRTGTDSAIVVAPSSSASLPTAPSSSRTDPSRKYSQATAPLRSRSPAGSTRRTLCCAHTRPRSPRSCRPRARARRRPPSRSSGAAREPPSRPRTPCPPLQAPAPAVDTAPIVTAAARPVPASPPRHGPACRACRGGRRRGWSAARR